MPMEARRRRSRASSDMVVSSWPSTRTLPELARSRPASTMSRLVLPEPDGPTMPTAAPVSMSRSRPCRMLTGPALDCTVRRRSRTRTIGPVASASGAERGEVMTSLAAGYGPRRRFLEALGVLDCLVFIRSAEAAPVRLLVLGDSLGAGYGLARDDAFQTRLAEALKAAGHDVAIVDG